MFGRGYRHRSTANIIAELSKYDPKSSMLFFYDDNFAANPRKTKELLREMIRLRLGFRWSTQVRSDIARDPEMLDLMAEAGCGQLYIGFESVDPGRAQGDEEEPDRGGDPPRHPGDPAPRRSTCTGCSSSASTPTRRPPRAPR